MLTHKLISVIKQPWRKQINIALSKTKISGSDNVITQSCLFFVLKRFLRPLNHNKSKVCEFENVIQLTIYFANSESFSSLSDTS